MGMVSYTFETLPPVSKEDWERIDAIKDEDIDYSDIPEMKDLSGFRPQSGSGTEESANYLQSGRRYCGVAQTGWGQLSDSPKFHPAPGNEPCTMKER